MVFSILAWMVFSFLFWRQLRNQAVTEEHIYQLMFYGTIAACIGARLGFVSTHWQLFAGNLWIRIFTLWIQPGLSFYGGFLGGGAVMLAMSRQFHIPRSLFLDAFTTGFSSAFTWGAMAAFLDGSVVGKNTALPFGVRIAGYDGMRHPVALYEMCAVFIILLLLYLVRRVRKTSLGKAGLHALWFFFFFSIAMFCLEFMKESRVYFSGLTFNQWVCIGIFGEAVGGLITWGGGKEFLKLYIPKAYTYVRMNIGGLYAKFSKRTAE
ncbi:MAG: Prolipoprotein diacylglyceryl transferase [Candidatus Gottesmanbacteria bacterium GW2011_GWA2_44_17]|uniref:Prolipoprotein diacylglyceryl transferase n=3 Tax=Candidatus Gottesmaniibacteriota TaxID=1752720 RepID=A0A0G1KQ40_9BACT|nr:MAG: Prolipoprotein diacylglyceryl transferase [Microgenomates group bacterium GW2011_GWC1_43_11]KKT35724.1 MAG: Prolipoprotein diacylglyceryl transferase [Candidatus Gottesmanbacteria bacterium GW2011_GWB1_44_11c]KKT45994.1 MAG: Prolipoprotein diacylglyceryl transferase [Candidatus Gottesmanbacteria bacterium GW2011_GWA2_44_17]KKT58447.1 MAG: Prolipoprotein diacylglyceryl transferase [Candidatus Gottesmanbacteria bacterium GW2011_GWA1_44_24b]